MMEKSTIYVSILLLHLSVFYYQSTRVHSLATPSENDFSYMDFVRNATELPSEDVYDYIVVGGGTAGCPLAATLSEKYKVLVLERGTVSSEYPSVLRSLNLWNNLMQPDDGKIPVQTFSSDEGVINARGRILGGSSMINAGVYCRAEEEFYETSGIDWDMDMVDQAYSWVEDKIVHQPINLDTWQSVVKAALLEAGVIPDNGFNLNFIPGTKIGGSTFDDQRRRHGADELLNNANPNNLLVAIRATVQKILFSYKIGSGLYAKGVIYTDPKGRRHQALVRGKGEVIVSAGAIGSPQLLLLSGVGPLSYLSSLHIPITRPQSHVGQFMFDNPRNFINIVPPSRLDVSDCQVAGITKDFYIEPISFNMSIDSNNVTLANINLKVPGPKSYGSLRLRSYLDATVPPNVSFNYFADPLDLARCVKGMRKIGEMLETSQLQQYRVPNSSSSSGTVGFNFYGPHLPMNQSDNSSFETFCKSTVATFWHYHGGCLVGKVVDNNLRVMGISSLRVVDGSIFNFSPGTNPQATVMMLGRYIGLKILQERASS